MPQEAVRQPAPRPMATPPKKVGRPSYVAQLSTVGGDEMVQLLPGRLVPLSGADEEIRFIKRPGVSRFTFGRSAGPAETHIQLLAPTASRMHAYVVIENGRWRIGNMSETNQVLVNGEALEAGDADRWLADGDRIELGEVGFIFRER
ncbi:MAG TPA: FHA domain-containing protein [Longimicrobiales bacterium]